MLNVDYKFTGQDLFNAVNEYRKSIGVQELQLDNKLCSNITDRWIAIREPEKGHKSFVEWAESNGVLFPDWYLNSLYKNRTNIYTIPQK